ncbi:hypothetical protein [Lysobacter solisilvae (ex Woo and Kim 2020)]|uniref:DUF305 domain-containing protein n=1 Tax=Agrilutibacter terrestris TaxID=2865112 RepID=A0A7H0G084_9GAMM|nr:hypothetical protein [Lysobacter terrestris]QNP41700.1 hypothetical protein H8B22_05695 [Lysobacter terrestris]
MKYLTFLLISGLLVPPGAQAHEGAHAAATPTAAVSAPKLQATLRTLWHGHVEKTREYAFAVKAGDARRSEAAANAVVANAKQLSAAVAGFYGKPAGERMLALLAGHWGAVKAMTDAERAGNRNGVNAAMATLTQNAGEIAVFLSGANPYLPQDAVRGLLIAHGAHHAAQISEVMRGDRVGEAKTWAAMQQHMDTIADAMAGALAKQFPKQAS